MTGRLAINTADVAAVSFGAGSMMDALPNMAVVLTTTLTVLSIVWLVIRIGEWLWRAGKWLRGRRTRRD